MDDLLKFIHARYEADNHAYAEVSYRFGGDALLDSHLPMLDLVGMLARDYAAMDSRTHASPASHTPFAYSPSPTLSTLTTASSGVPRVDQRHRPWSRRSLNSWDKLRGAGAQASVWKIEAEDCR